MATREERSPSHSSSSRPWGRESITLVWRRAALPPSICIGLRQADVNGIASEVDVQSLEDHVLTVHCVSTGSARSLAARCRMGRGFQFRGAKLPSFFRAVLR